MKRRATEQFFGKNNSEIGKNTFETCWLGCIPGAVFATADGSVSKESVSVITVELHTGAKG